MIFIGKARSMMTSAATSPVEAFEKEKKGEYCWKRE
jgi:hypothetical protein